MIKQPKPIFLCFFKSLLLLTLLPVASSAQPAAPGQDGFKQGPRGLLYRIYNPHAGPRIKDGDFISANVVAKTESNSVIFNTYERGIAFMHIMQRVLPGDVMSGIEYMAEGDSAVIKSNIDSIDKGRSRLPIKGKYIIYNVKIERVILHSEPPDTTAFNERVKVYIASVNDAMKQAEPGKIKKYAADRQLNMNVTAAGLNYVITRSGSGIAIATGDTVDVLYTGRFVNGKVFETNIRAVAVQAHIYHSELTYEIIRVTVGWTSVWPGWDEVMPLLNKGARAVFIVPSALAYGEQGNQEIPPNMPLVFEIEVVDIVKPK